MDGGAACMIGHREDIVRLGVAGNSPGVLAGATGYVLPNVFRIFIGIGIHNNILETKILAGIHDPYGYFATIGDENLSFQSFPH